MGAQPTIQMTAAARDCLRRALATGGDDTNPEYLFSTANTALLLAVEAGLIDAERLARAELASRGLDASGVWCGFDRAQEIHLGTDADAAAEQTVANIARRLLHLDTLVTRNADALDFARDLAVWSIRDTLVAAYTAGAKAAGNGRKIKLEG